jgi:hypothetical protein
LSDVCAASKNKEAKVASKSKEMTGPSFGSKACTDTNSNAAPMTNQKASPPAKSMEDSRANVDAAFENKEAKRKLNSETLQPSLADKLLVACWRKTC